MEQRGGIAGFGAAENCYAAGNVSAPGKGGGAAESFITARREAAWRWRGILAPGGDLKGRIVGFVIPPGDTASPEETKIAVRFRSAGLRAAMLRIIRTAPTSPSPTRLRKRLILTSAGAVTGPTIPHGSGVGRTTPAGLYWQTGDLIPELPAHLKP
jgi:hypothetical protein